MTYAGNGKLNLRGNERQVKHFALITGGTGITIMYQISLAILEDPTDESKVTLLFANRSTEDILMKEELEAAVKDPRIKVFYTIDKAEADWKGYTGHVLPTMIKETLPGPSDDVFIAVVGPPGMEKCMRPILDSLGYSNAKNRY